MALIKCKECGKEVSTKAKSCPNCGNTEFEETFSDTLKEWREKGEQMSPEEGRKALIYASITIVICIAFGIWVFYSLTK